MSPLWPGYTLATPILRPDPELRFYRGVPLRSNEMKPSNIQRISYPPPHLVTKYQRANRIGESRFYCSTSRGTTLYELGVHPGDYIIISRWHLRTSLIATNIGYTNKVLDKYNGKRTEKDIWWKKSDEKEEINQLIHEFFSDSFSQQIINGEEHQYKLSIAISEGLFGNPAINGVFPSNIKNQPEECRLGILLYPSFARKANTDNVVILPEFIDKYFELKYIEYIYIDKVMSDKNINLTIMDFANSTELDGTIEWRGRAPVWSGTGNISITFGPNGEKIIRDSNGKLILQISIEDGQEIARNESGKIVDPE